jgi:hypothetical protein
MPLCNSSCISRPPEHLARAIRAFTPTLINITFAPRGCRKKMQRRGSDAESHEVSGTEEAASLPEPRRRARARGVAFASEPTCFPHVVRRA